MSTKVRVYKATKRNVQVLGRQCKQTICAQTTNFLKKKFFVL